MTVKIYPYLTFENAKEAMDYYVANFDAKIIYHQPLDKEQAESIGLDPNNLSGTTMYGEFQVAGQKIVCADATMGNPQTSTAISIMLCFGEEKDQARQFFDHLADSDQQKVTVPYGNWVLGSTMGQVVDRYGLTWIICTGNNVNEAK